MLALSHLRIILADVKLVMVAVLTRATRKECKNVDMTPQSFEDVVKLNTMTRGCGI